MAQSPYPETPVEPKQSSPNQHLRSNRHEGLFPGLKSMPIPHIVLSGYLLYVLIGWIVLSIPFCHKNISASPLDHLFIATSAVSTTGLTTISVSDSYSLLGQIIVLILIQLGGIGYMTVGSFLILSQKGELSDFRKSVGNAVYSLPKGFRVDKFIRSVVTFTLVIEILGATFLYFPLRASGTDNPVWSAIFHSISAFCTAGFGLYNNSFESYSTNYTINIIIAVLSYLGAIGFIVCVDVWRLMRGKVKYLTVTSRIILSVTFWMSLAGTITIFLTEPSIENAPTDIRLLQSFFQCMTAMTTVGFNTTPIGGLAKATILLTVVLMVIGASPSGTGGGIKTTTLSAILGVMRSAIRGETTVKFWGKAIPLERLWMAFATVGFYLGALLFGTFFLELTEKASFDAIVFEAASALGTVGLSMGITSSLTVLGKIIIILLMFCGRVGPLTFGAALFCSSAVHEEEDKADLAI